MPVQLRLQLVWVSCDSGCVANLAGVCWHRAYSAFMCVQTNVSSQSSQHPPSCPACRVCLGGGKPCPSVAATSSGGSTSSGSSGGSSSGTGGTGGSVAAAAVDTTPPVIILGNASCAAGSTAAGSAAVSNLRAVTAAGTEVMLTSVPVGELRLCTEPALAVLGAIAEPTVVCSLVFCGWQAAGTLAWLHPACTPLQALPSPLCRHRKLQAAPSETTGQRGMLWTAT